MAELLRADERYNILVQFDKHNSLHCAQWCRQHHHRIGSGSASQQEQQNPGFLALFFTLSLGGTVSSRQLCVDVVLSEGF